MSDIEDFKRTARQMFEVCVYDARKYNKPETRHISRDYASQAKAIMELLERLGEKMQWPRP